MALPAVQGSFLPESVCGDYEPVEVDPVTSPPYEWICFLTIEIPSGTTYASGFKIYLPDLDSTTIVTSGRVTYLPQEGFPNSITVKFPEQEEIEVKNWNDMYAAPEFIYSANADYNYGLILLPGAGNSDDGFGWSVIVSDEELNNRVVINCGYPFDKPEGTMWITGRKITNYTKREFYINYSYGGLSGSPVYTWYSGYWTVVGVHSAASTNNNQPVCPNVATRFTIQMIYRFLEFMNEITTKSLKSAAPSFPGVYVRCDGQGVTSFQSNGAGTVNCQYQPPGVWEQFYIYPVEVPPSLAVTPGPFKVVIESKAFQNVFIRLDGQNMTQFESNGGGVVNCQYDAFSWEIYYLETLSTSTPSVFAFRSVQYPHCYIRLDGNGVHSYSSNGGGTVNCQWYSDPSTSPPAANSWESFNIVCTKQKKLMCHSFKLFLGL